MLRLELFFIRMAIKVLIGRNSKRCLHVSRRDNNDMWSMGERLQLIHDRMKSKYQDD